jgi:RimJ/RimL family protein N-acetyltransferase
MTPTLQTERLTLRPARPADAARIALYTNDPEVAQMLGGAAFPNTVARAEGKIFLDQARALLGQEHWFVIDLPGEGVIGEVRVALGAAGAAEIGYWLARPSWGQGFGEEAARAAAAFAATLGRGLVRAACAEGDEASEQALQRAGFRRRAKLEQGFCLVRRAPAARVGFDLAG